MRSTETIEEMNERNARLEGCDLRNESEVSDFLYGIGREHRPAGGTAGHDVRMVSKDGEGMGGESARRDMHRGRGEFTGDFVHIGNHQQETLRCGEGGGECAGLQGPVQCARSAAFALQFFDDRKRAPDILSAFGAPLVSPLGHGGRRGNGVDRDNLGESIGNRSSSLVSIDNHRFQFTHAFCLTARPLGVLPLP